MAKNPRIAKLTSREDIAREAITHGSIGRINVELSETHTTLRLSMWALGPETNLAPAEVDRLIEKLQVARERMGGRKPASATVAAVVEDCDLD